MEEKKATKISLSTFLLFIAIIAIIVMGVFIYKLNNEKTIETQKSIKLQSQVNGLKETVSDLQGKINGISETTDFSTVTENKTTAYDAEKTEDSTNQAKVYSYSLIKGVYKGTAKNAEKNDEKTERTYELCLFENGTFKYISYTSFEDGYIGNYTIDDNKIMLNYWFSTGSDAGLSATNGTKTLKINEDNSIMDSKPNDSNSPTLTLKKISSNESKDDVDNINYLINTFVISNKNNS